jgi:16S rRNA (uracil1498-N3)-methyltransferase
MSDRFFYPGSLHVGEVLLTDTEAHHLLHVLRAEVGTSVELFDGRGTVASGKVIELHRKDAKIELHEVHNAPEHKRLTLLTAVPKGDRFRWLIEKATELGVSRLVPISTERSVVNPRETKLKKLEQTVISACKQSGRNWMMQISEVIALKDALKAISESTTILAGHPDGIALNEVDLTTTEEIAMLIGPEGGFTADEADWLQQANVQLVSLGSNILRTETAGIALTSWITLGT